MPVAISTTLYGSTIPRLVQITVTGLAAATDVTVRAEATGSPDRVIRGASHVDPPGDALVLIDPMPELGRPIIYAVEFVDPSFPSGAIVSALPITVDDTGRHVLSDPYDGEAVLVDVVAGPDTRDNEARGAVLYPRGAASGIARFDVRNADTGKLNVYTTDVPALVALLASGSPIVSRHPNDGCDQPAVEVLYIGTAARSRFSRAGDRVFELPFAVVQLPDPALPLTSATLGQLNTFYVASGGTLADIAADFSTLLDVARAEWV